jgi:hypothetical protein
MLMTRLLAAVCCSMLSIPPVAFCQERAPNGQIYGELQPFVGLESVTVRVDNRANNRPVRPTLISVSAGCRQGSAAAPSPKEPTDLAAYETYPSLARNITECFEVSHRSLRAGPGHSLRSSSA